MAEIIEYIAIKSYTDLEQSKKLAKILPIESADMWHHGFFHPLRMCKIEYNPPAPYHSVNSQWDCPCWSLAALLKLMPTDDKKDEYYVVTESHSDYHIVSYRNCWDGLVHSEYSKESLLDAAFEMVVWLKENKKL